MTHPSPPLLAALAALLTGCAAPALLPGPATETEVIRVQTGGPPNAQPGSCWARETTPATIETVTDQILLQPAEIGSDGSVRSPAVYKTEQRQRITRERQDLWFETLCAERLTPDFVSALQRALAARGVYRGPVTGALDARTDRAIRAWQKPQGLDSKVLSLAGARKLGLVVVRDPSG